MTEHVWINWKRPVVVQFEVTPSATLPPETKMATLGGEPKLRVIQSSGIEPVDLAGLLAVFGSRLRFPTGACERNYLQLLITFEPVQIPIKSELAAAVRSLRGPKPSLRVLAAEALGTIGSADGSADASVVRALEEARRDPENAVRKAAERALQKITGHS